MAMFFLILCEVKIYFGAQASIVYLKARGKKNPYFYSIEKTKDGFLAKIKPDSTPDSKEKNFFLNVYKKLPGTRPTEKSHELVEFLHNINPTEQQEVQDILQDYVQYYLVQNNQNDPIKKEIILYDENKKEIKLQNITNCNQPIAHHLNINAIPNTMEIMGKQVFSLDPNIQKIIIPHGASLSKITNIKLATHNNLLCIYKNQKPNFHITDLHDINIKDKILFRKLTNYKTASWWMMFVSLLIKHQNEMIEILKKDYNELKNWTAGNHVFNHVFKINKKIFEVVPDEFSDLLTLEIDTYEPALINLKYGISFMIELNSKGRNQRIDNFLIPLYDYALFFSVNCYLKNYLGNDQLFYKKPIDFDFLIGLRISFLGLCILFNYNKIFQLMNNYFSTPIEQREELQSLSSQLLLSMLNIGIVINFSKFFIVVYYNAQDHSIGFIVIFYPINYSFRSVEKKYTAKTFDPEFDDIEVVLT